MHAISEWNISGSNVEITEPSLGTIYSSKSWNDKYFTTPIFLKCSTNLIVLRECRLV